METILFTKDGCNRCDWLKANCDLSGVTVLNCGNADGLALLAYYELVVDAEKNLPILVYDRSDYHFSVTEFDAVVGELGGSYLDFTASCEGDSCKL